MELNNKKQPKNKEIYVLSRKKIFDISEFYNLTPGNTKKRVDMLCQTKSFSSLYFFPLVLPHNKNFWGQKFFRKKIWN